MKKNKIKIISLIIVLLLNCFTFYTYAEDTNSDTDILQEFSQTVLQSSVDLIEQPQEVVAEDETVFCNVSLEENFNDDIVIVYIKKEYSVVQQQYTASDFPYLELSGVETIFTYKPEINNRIGLCLYLKNTGKQNVIDAINLLQQDLKVQLAVPDYIFTAQQNDITVTTDDNYDLVDERIPSINSGICCAQKYTQSEAAGLHSKYNASVKVGIVDTGIYGTYQSSTNSDVSNCISSITDKVIEYKDYTTAYTSIPASMHGTNIASVIAKSTDISSDTHTACSNNIYQGVCQNVQLYSLNVCSSTSIDEAENGAFNMAYNKICEAMEYAQNNGVKILNMSISYTCEKGSTAYTALENALNQYTGLIVCSAGNDSADIENQQNKFPRNFESDRIIVVGAARYDSLSNKATKSSESNSGQTEVDLFAYDQAYGFKSSFEKEGDYVIIDKDSIVRKSLGGTSLATARVSGAAAVLLNIDPDLTAAQLRHYILAGVDPSTNLASLCTSGGSLNVYKSAKILISDMACEYETIFAGHFTDTENLQVAAYVQAKTGQLKCYVWTFDQSTKSFSDPEHWFTNNAFGLKQSDRVNLYRSVAGNFDGDGKDEICTLYDYADYLFIEGDGYTSHPGSINLPVENFTGRVTVGDYDNDGKDEIAAFYQMPDVWAHTKLYVWDFTGSKAALTAAQHLVYDSGEGNYAASYITDRVVSGDFDGDGSDEVAALYYYSSTGKYNLQKFELNITNNTASFTNLIKNSDGVDVSKVSGRVVACNYNGGGDDEIVCLYDNSETLSDGIINYGIRFTSTTNSWQATALYTSSANVYRAENSKYLVVSGDFSDTDYASPDGLDDIVTLYKLPAANELDVRGKLYISFAPDLYGYTSKWDPKS